VSRKRSKRRAKASSFRELLLVVCGARRALRLVELLPHVRASWRAFLDLLHERVCTGGWPDQDFAA
jgi:hypothetical protein